MPNYDYHCTHCGHKEEILQKMTDQPIKECPQCHHSSFVRQFGCGIGLQFQGSGFYSTDYQQKNSKGQETSKSHEPSSDPSSSSPQKGCGCGKSSCGA